MPTHKKIYKRTNFKKGSDIPLFIRSYLLLVRFLILLGDIVRHEELFEAINQNRAGDEFVE